jgi:hypothetical protein
MVALIIVITTTCFSQHLNPLYPDPLELRKKQHPGFVINLPTDRERRTKRLTKLLEVHFRDELSPAHRVSL